MRDDGRDVGREDGDGHGRFRRSRSRKATLYLLVCLGGAVGGANGCACMAGVPAIASAASGLTRSTVGTAAPGTTAASSSSRAGTPGAGSTSPSAGTATVAAAAGGDPVAVGTGSRTTGIRLPSVAPESVGTASTTRPRMEGLPPGS